MDLLTEGLAADSIWVGIVFFSITLCLFPFLRVLLSFRQDSHHFTNTLRSSPRSALSDCRVSDAELTAPDPKDVGALLWSGQEQAVLHPLSTQTAMGHCCVLQ